MNIAPITSTTEVILLTMLLVMFLAVITLLFVNIWKDGLLETLIKILSSGPW
jgi:hypothetical protein